MSIPAFSVAIRLGAMMRPQGLGGIVWEEGASCACGAALEAIGQHKANGGFLAKIHQHWPWTEKHVDLPRWENHGDLMIRMCSRDSIAELASQLNVIGYSRERIADWVETLEQQLEAQATPQLEVEHVTN